MVSILVALIAIGLSLYVLYATRTTIPTQKYRVSFLAIALVLTSVLYVRGYGASRRSAKSGATKAAPAVKPWQGACFAGAMLALAVALVSPLDALGSSLLTAHMAQHLLLLVVVPPLLVLSAPGYVLAWSLPLPARRGLALTWNRSGWQRGWATIAAVLFTPLAALLVYTGTVWLWHAPNLYQAALANEAVHVFEHATFLAAAYLFWSVLLAPLGRHRANRGVAAAMVFGASVQGSALGALMAFSPTPWYAAYAATTPAWGLTPLGDQQLAGVVMWMPVGTVYVILACLLVWLWLRDPAPPSVSRLRPSATGGE